MPEDSAPPAVERRIVSVLFADLVGFTSLSEQLDPEDVATVQDAYFATVRETVARHGGVLEKFIGDAAMAVFGIPRARDDDAERAIRSGLALVGAVDLLGARLGLAEGAALRLRVGVNTGEVVSAESGPDTGRVTGDTVNLAARFQAAAEPGTVLVGELTQLSAADAVELIPMGGLELKGKAEPVQAWQVTGLRPERSREEALGALRAPLLGRETEMAALATALEAARGDALQLVLVAPPGVGKSRLLAEFAARADAQGARVLRARVRADMLGPAEPVSQLLVAALKTLDATSREVAPAALARALGEAGASAARIEVVTAEVVDTLWPPAAAPAAPPDRDARFGAWLEALDALAGEAASAWLVEDIHWAGPDLLAFLDRAGRELSRGGRLVAATARPSVLEHLAEGTETLDLPPLPTLNAGELVHALVGEALPEDLVAAVADRSDGNPLFIEELLRSWISSGTLVGAPDGGWQLAVPPDAVPLPATVQAIYAAQLDDLPAEARLVARRASVAGRRFAVRALEPLEVPSPEAGLASLRQRAFLRGPETDLAGDEVYAYRHALLRDAGYASLSRAERERLHRALAAWLEQTAGSDFARVAEPIASHYESALAALPAVGTDPAERERLTDAARTWLERAADAALAVGAPDAALALLARAVGLAETGSLEDARLRLRRGELLAVAGDMALGITEIERALETGRAAFHAEPGDPARSVYAGAVAALADAMIEQIRFLEARDLVTDALRDLSPPDDGLVGRLLAYRALANTNQTDLDGTAEEAERAFRLVADAGDPRLELEVRHRRAVVRASNGLDIGAEWAEIERLAAELGQWDFVLRAMGNQTQELMFHAPLGEVIARAEGARDLAEAHGLTERLVWCQYLLVDLHLASGDWDRAVDIAFSAIATAERNAYVRAAFRTWLTVGAILAARGDRARLEPYRDWWARNRHHFPMPPSPYGQTNMTAIDHRLRSLGLEPLTEFDVGPETMAAETYDNPDWLVGVEEVVYRWIAGGQRDRAAEGVRLQHLAWPADRDGAGIGLAAANLPLLDAWLARAEGRPEDAAARARSALLAARAAEAPWWVARAIRALPEGAATVEELAEAEAIERRLGAAPGASAPPV